MHWNGEVCGGQYPTFTSTNDPFSPTYATQRAQVKGAWADAEWMILREGVWDKTLNFSSTCTGTWNTGAWFDAGEDPGISSGWYESLATVASYCSTGDVGCTGYDWVLPGFSEIIAADISIAKDFNWGVLNQDTVADYLENEAFQNCASWGTRTGSTTPVRRSARWATAASV